MANEQIIDELIDPKAFAQLDKLIADLGIARTEFVSFAKAIEQANKAISKSQSYKDLEANSNASLVAIEALRKKTAEADIAEQKLSAARTKAANDFERKVQKEMSAQARQSTQSDKITAKQLADEAKKEAAYKKSADQLQKNSRPYTVLSNTLEDQRKKAQDLAIIYGENSTQFQNAAKGVIELDTRLKAIDATLGKNQRNVGNYKSGFDQFSNSINQLTRELPALAVNAQTFFLAISNNLPALFDAIQNANAAQKESKKAAIADAEAKGQATKATELAAGASEEAASAAGDFAKEQALAAAEAIKTPGAFKQFVGSLFSLQTALSLGVTLLTIYGAQIVEFIGELIKGNDGLDDARKKVENLNKAFEDPSIAEATKNIGELTINIDLAKKGFLDKEKVLKQYNESIGNTTGEVTSLEQAEKSLAKNAKAYVEMTLFKAAAQITLEEAAKASVKAAQEAAERERNIIKQTTSFVINGDKEGEAARKILVKDRKRLNEEQKADAEDQNNQLLGIARDFQTKAAEIAKNNKFDFFGAQLDTADKEVNTDAIDLLIQRVQFEADKQKEIAGNEKNTLDERLDAIKNSYDASIRLSELNAKKELSQAGLTADRIKAIREKQANDVTVAETERLNSNIKLNEDANKKLADLFKKGIKDFEDAEKKKIEDLQVSLAEQAVLNQEFADSALLGLAEQYSQGLINEFQYAKGKLDIQRQYVIDSLNQEIDGIQRIIDAKKKAGLDTVSDEKALSVLRKKLSKETADQEITDLVKVAEMSKKLNEKKVEIAREVANLGTAIVNAGFTNQKNKLQEEQDAFDLRTQKEIEAVNDSVATQEEKANAIKIIEARAAAQKTIQDQKQRELDQRKARFDKAVQAASIVGNTAVAIMKTYAEFGFPIGVPLAIAQGVIGAVQLATVLATPIPKFEKGGINKRDGLIMTGEAGAELRINPDGTKEITDSKANITYAKAGTKIIPHHEFMKMTAKNEINVTKSGDRIDLSPIIASQERQTKEITKALGKQKHSGTIITKAGWQNTQSQMDAIKQYKQRNFGS